jgi:hypothetical protein
VNWFVATASEFLAVGLSLGAESSIVHRVDRAGFVALEGRGAQSVRFRLLAREHNIYAI